MKTMNRRRERGLSLVELMVAMTIGLFLLAGVSSVFVSTGQVSRTNQNLSRLQDSARFGFTLLARDLRESGLNDCGRMGAGNVVNVLNGGSLASGLPVDPMLDWGTNGGILGFDNGVASPGVATGGATGERIGTEDAIHVMSGGSIDAVVASHNSAGSITLAANSSLQTGDLAILCDFGMASLLQLGNVDKTSVAYAAGGATPGNCSIGLDRSSNPCTTPKLAVYKANSSLLSFKSVIWYVGNNGRPETGGRSLYRMRVVNSDGAGAIASVAEEMVEGVSGLQFQYLVAGADTYVDATAVALADWANVLAVKVTVTLSGAEIEGNTGAAQRMQRTYSNVVTLRNRVS